MLHLLKLEWLKLKDYFMFRAIMLLYFILLPTTVLIFRIPGDPPEELAIPSFYIFPHIWESLGYAGNWLTFFLFGFLAILMVSNEFSFKTFRQNIMTGVSRRDFITSKILMFLVLSAVAAIYYFVIALAFGYYNTDYVKDISYAFENAEMVFRFFLMVFAYMSFAFMIVILVRRSGFALLIYTIYTIIIELILRYFVHYKLFGMNKAFWYYPLNSIEDLVYPSFFNAGNVAKDIELALLSPTEAIVLTLVYTTIFLLVPYTVIQKRDL
ncbi:MAG: ABC transporter permease [Bacteroidota bacterium]